MSFDGKAKNLTFKVCMDVVMVTSLQQQPAGGQQQLALPAPPGQAQAAAPNAQPAGPPQLVHHPQHQHVMGHARREATNEYAALFVALIGMPSEPLLWLEYVSRQ